MFPYLRVAALNLTLQKRRSALLGLAIAIVTLLLLLLLAFVGGVTFNLTQAALTISTGHVNLGGFVKTRIDRAQAVITGTDRLLPIIQQTLPDIDYVLGRGRGWGRVISPQSSLNTSLIGIDWNDLQRMPALKLLSQIKDASGMPDPKVFQAGAGAILFKGQAERLQVTIGDVVTFVTESNGGATGTADLTVVGIASDLGFLSNFSIVVAASTISRLYNFDPNTTTGALHIYLKDIRKAPSAMESLRTKLMEAGYEVLSHDPQPFFLKFRRIISEDWKGSKLDLTIWEDEVSFLYWIITSLNGLSIFLIAVLGMIIAVGIANTTWMSVRERTREMGTLRAIGMEKHQVMLLYLIEAVMLGFLSSGFGALLSYLLVYILNLSQIQVSSSDLRAFLMSDSLSFVLSFAQLASSVGVISLLTGFAAAYPAWKASRLEPVAALSHAS